MTQDAVATPARRDRRFLIAVLALLATAGLVMAGTATLLRSRAAAERAQALDRTLALEARLVRARLERIEAIAAELLATTPPGELEREAASGETDDADVPLRERLASFATARRLDLAGVFGPERAVLWTGLAGAGQEPADGSELARVARRLGADPAVGPGARVGLVAGDGALYALAHRVGDSPDEARRPLGVLVAQRIDQSVARELDQALEGELAFLVDTNPGFAVGADTLDAERSAALPVAVRLLGNWTDLLPGGGTYQLDLGGEPWEMQLAPLPGIERASLGVAVALLPRRGGGPGPFLALEALLALVAAAGLALLLLPAKRPAPATPQEHPAQRLVAALARARGTGSFQAPGDLPAELEPLGSGIAGLWAERQQLEQEALAGRRRGPVRFELSSADGPLDVVVEELALLAVELRSLAKSDTVKQPQGVLARTKRDVQDLRAKIERRGGRVEAWVGHRLLASFAGSRAVVDAVDVAAEIAVALGSPASAFEEPRPPAFALAYGAVAVGVVSDDPTATRALAGRPVQQLEEVLREAMAGDLLATQDVGRRAATALEERGIALREHAGLRTAQKLYSIDLVSVGVPREERGASPVVGAVPERPPIRWDDAGADDDWADLAAAAVGDEPSFERLVSRHQRRLHSLCLRLLQDPAEAEEAVQEVFLKLYRRADRFEQKGQLFTLLYRIATNLCLNRLRRRRIVRFVSLGGRQGEEEEPLAEPEDEAPPPSERLLQRARWTVVRRAIERLPASQRAVLLLVRLEGLSYQQAADALGISLGAVESRLFRAMRRLEAALEEEAPK